MGMGYTYQGHTTFGIHIFDFVWFIYRVRISALFGSWVVGLVAYGCEAMRWQGFVRDYPAVSQYNGALAQLDTIIALEDGGDEPRMLARHK